MFFSDDFKRDYVRYVGLCFCPRLMLSSDLQAFAAWFYWI